jgi:hypothetical protein
MKNPWEGLEGPTYHIENLGRPAMFLIPSHKLRTPGLSGKTPEEDLNAFLSEKFGAFNTTPVPEVGFWKNAQQRLVYDECRRYKVSFVGKERIPELFAKLSEICTAIGEDCLYVEAGQYSGLLYPGPRTPK